MIDDIFVEDEAREVGVGEAMVNDLIDWCEERKCIGIDAMALPGHRATKNFFEKFGFTARKLVMHQRLRERPVDAAIDGRDPSERRHRRARSEEPGVRPEVCVGAIAVEEGRLLLIRRGHGPAAGEWSIPGGRVEAGETLAEAVVRELLEETGVEGVCDRMVGWVERIGDDHHFVILDFSVTVLLGPDEADPRRAATRPRRPGCRSTRWPTCDLVEGLAGVPPRARDRRRHRLILGTWASPTRHRVVPVAVASLVGRRRSRSRPSDAVSSAHRPLGRRGSAAGVQALGRRLDRGAVSPMSGVAGAASTESPTGSGRSVGVSGASCATVDRRRDRGPGPGSGAPTAASVIAELHRRIRRAGVVDALLGAATPPPIRRPLPPLRLSVPGSVSTGSSGVPSSPGRLPERSVGRRTCEPARRRLRRRPVGAAAAAWSDAPADGWDRRPCGARSASADGGAVPRAGRPGGRRWRGRGPRPGGGRW